VEPEKKTNEEVVELIQGVEKTLEDAVDKMTKEIETRGSATKETAAKVDEMTKEMVKLAGEADERQTALDAQEAAIKERMDELEKKLARGELPPEGSEQYKSPGEVFASSEEIKRMVDRNELSCAPVRMNTLFPGVDFLGQKADLLSSAATRLVVPQRSEMVGALERMLRIRDLIPTRPTSSNAIEYVREIGFHDSDTTAVTSIATSSGVATLVATAHGFTVGQRIIVRGCTELLTLNGLQYVVTTADANTLTFATGEGDDTDVSGTITVIAADQHGAAAGVAEAGTKPEAALELSLETEAVQVIAHWIPASRQVLADATQLEAYVNDRLRYGVLYEEERQLLYGTGSSPQIQGIMTEVGVQNYNWSDGVVSPVDTKIDAIRRGMGQAQVNEHFPTGLVVNSVDWTDIQLAKGSDGHYIWASVGSGTEQRFFLLPIAVTNAIASGTALTGAFQTATTLWDRQQVGIRVSESHASFFIENMVAILAEERVAQTIYRPDAFVTITFDAAPS